MKPMKSWLVGRWQAHGEEIGVIFNIDDTGGGFRIQAIDPSDGEELVVSKVKWNGKELSFETRTRSNKWRTKNRLRVVSKTKAVHELTYWEPWVKIKTESGGKGAIPAHKRRALQSADTSLSGASQSPDK